MRLIVAGTGGSPLAGPQVIRPNSEVRGAAWGVLKMTLRSENYSWQFVPCAGIHVHRLGHRHLPVMPDAVLALAARIRRTGAR